MRTVAVAIWIAPRQLLVKKQTGRCVSPLPDHLFIACGQFAWPGVGVVFDTRAGMAPFQQRRHLNAPNRFVVGASAVH